MYNILITKKEKGTLVIKWRGKNDMMQINLTAEVFSNPNSVNTISNTA